MSIPKILVNHWRVMLVQLALVVVVLSSFATLNSRTDVVSIAILIDANESKNNTRVESLLLYAKRINRFGGINGKTLEIEPYFNHSNSKEAEKVACEIVESETVIAVLGDFDYTLSPATIAIYDKAEIPLILTKSNIKTLSPWVFQMSPTSESYGTYMAYYAYNILGKKSVNIVHSQIEDGLKLIEAFTKKFKTMGGEIKTTMLLSEDTTSYFNSLNKDVNYTKDDSLLLLIGDKKQTVPLIAMLKKASINIPIFSTDTELGNQFDIYPEEKSHAGYFSDGIYVASSIHVDNLSYDLTAIRNDYEKKHNEYIPHKALMTALSIVKVVNHLGDEIKDIEEVREELKSKLRSDKYFDKERQAVGGVLTIGKFDRQYLVTAPIDPMMLELGDVSETERVKTVEVDEKYLYPTDIIYTGISMNKMSDINMENLTYKMDFLLWFRYKDTVKGVDDIEFLNSVKPARLSDIVGKESKAEESKKGAVNIMEDMKATVVEKVSYNGETYIRYHIEGYFKTSNAKNYALGRQNLYVKFRNYNATKYKLAYVTDYFNSNKGIFSQEETNNTNIFEELKFDVIEEPSLTLNYNLSYVSRSYKTMLGNPAGTIKSNEFSEFIAQYSIKPVLWSVRGIESWINSLLPGGEDTIEVPSMVLFLALSLMVFIFTLYGKKEEFFGSASTYWWLLQLFIIFCILLFTEFALSQALFDLKYSPWGRSSLDTINSLMNYSNRTIALLWWIVPAYYITSAFEQFLWHPIEKQTGAEVPNVLRLFVTIIVYVFAFMGIIAYVFEVTMTGLAATSGVLAIFFAVASKVDISNIIAGLGISFSKVFKLGDWVKIGDVEGKVVEMTPRSTKVLTFESSIINIPNTAVSGSIVENYTRPNPAFRLMIRFEIVPLYRFEDVEKVLLDAVASTEGVLDKPSPSVNFHGQGDSSQIFEVTFFIDDYSKKGPLWQSTWRRIWRHLEQADITLATPQREIFMPKAELVDISAPLSVMKNSGAFEHLSDEEKEMLSKKLIEQSYLAGEVILEKYATTEDLFIITEGVIAFGNNIEEKDFKRLGVAEIFGAEQESLDTTVVFAKTDSKVLILKEANL